MTPRNPPRRAQRRHPKIEPKIEPRMTDERPRCDGCHDELEWDVLHECDVLGTAVLVSRRCWEIYRPTDRRCELDAGHDDLHYAKGVGQWIDADPTVPAWTSPGRRA